MYPWIFPTAEFVTEQEEWFRTKPFYVVPPEYRAPDTKPIDPVQLYCGRFGTNAVMTMLQDPFLCRHYRNVAYNTHTPRPELEYYYTNLFAEAGWRTVRERIDLETATFGMFCRVYGRGEALVRLQIRGFEDAPDDHGVDGFCYWQIQFHFLDMEPSALLGSDYRKKGSEVFNVNYHVVEVERNRNLSRRESNKSLESDE